MKAKNNKTLKTNKDINYDSLLCNNDFAQYLILVGIRSLDYTYDDNTLFANIEYFKLCKDHGLSAYKSLLYLHDYLNGDYIFSTCL